MVIIAMPSLIVKDNIDIALVEYLEKDITLESEPYILSENQLSGFQNIYGYEIIKITSIKEPLYPGAISNTIKYYIKLKKNNQITAIKSKL